MVKFSWTVMRRKQVQLFGDITDSQLADLVARYAVDQIFTELDPASHGRHKAGNRF